MPDDMSEVHIAFIQGNVEKVRTALDRYGSAILGIDDQFGTTLLHYATLEPNILNMAVKYARETLLNITDGMGNTPLHHSIRYECIESVAILVGAHGCNVNQSNFEGETPLIAACKYSSRDILQLLLTCERCDLNACDKNGDTALHIAINTESNDQLENVQCLLQSVRCDPNVTNKSGCTPLHIVCRQGDVPLLEALLKNGANILQTSNDSLQNAPIHIACQYGRLDSLKVLLCCTNRNPNQQNAAGNTALHIVCRKRNSSELQFFQVLTSTPGINPTLVNHEGIAPFEVVDNDGNTLLHIACAKGNSTMVDFLVKNGADVLTQNRHGDAPIHIACRHSQLNCLKVILSSKSCNPNQQNHWQDTALHIVCRMIINKAMPYFLSTPGINPRIVPFESETGRELQFLQLLTSTPGINTTLVNYEGISLCNVVGNDGNTLLHITCAKGNVTTVGLLLKNGADILKCKIDNYL